MGIENVSFRAPEGVGSKEKDKNILEAFLDEPKKLKSAVNRFVGENALKNQLSLEGRFHRSSKNAKLANFEREMPPDLEKAVEQINSLLVTFLKEWGLEEYVEIDARNIVLGDIWNDKKLKDAYRTQAGTYHSIPTRIRILTPWQAGNYRGFVKVLVHEMIHMEAFQSWESESESELEPPFQKSQIIRAYPSFQRRQGVRIGHDDGYESFAWLDEAITEELAKRFMQKYEKDIEILNGMRKPAVIAEKVIKWHPLRDGHSYKKQREALSQLITSIHIHGRKKYKSRDDVLRLFTNAALNGRLLPVARAIEKARGKGAFKKLAELDIDMNEGDAL